MFQRICPKIHLGEPEPRSPVVGEGTRLDILGVLMDSFWTPNNQWRTSCPPPLSKGRNLVRTGACWRQNNHILEFQTLLLAIIQGYAPTNKAGKDDWYKELQGTVSKLPLGVQGQQEFKQWRLWLSLRESWLGCDEHQQGVCFKAEKLFHCFWASGGSSWRVPWYQHHMGNQEGPVGWEELLKSSMQHKDNKERLACGHKTNKTS